ncbi:hypothetical protein [Xylocopilactobacillus apis]|uniref:Uncharacterized protein n=1 Tax=Xylocopilactobacillus apis TaxID=2932183 RepID=A0AAU9CT04_9LACO|nr:hypothetical protein [Xylocopilactobacillus apis]BDR57134.1 hypothetical protein KIMC2_16960 [Xylocopilactobacillus apis]
MSDKTLMDSINELKKFAKGERSKVIVHSISFDSAPEFSSSDKK